MCWFRPAFAIALDCAATRAGDSAWADRPGLPHRLADVLVQRHRNAAMHALSELAVVRAGRNLARGAQTRRPTTWQSLMKKISPPGTSGDEVAADERRGGDSDPAQA